MALAFLVDGHTEQRFISIICPNRPVQRLGLNGNSVSAQAIAIRAATNIRLWGGKYFPVVILIDLENRTISHDEFADLIRASLELEGIQDEVIICIAKRMLENWILGDSELLGWDDAPESVDDIHGAHTLRKVLGEYDKAGDGPQLLRNARPSMIRLRSPSFESTFNLLSNMNCNWLTR